MKHWKSEETRALVTLRLEMESQFVSSKSHSVLWNEIHRKLTELRVKCTVTQAMNKFKQLKRTWKATIDNNSKTGAERKTCLFEDEFGVAYGTKAGTRPTFTMGSFQPPAPARAQQAAPARAQQAAPARSQQAAPARAQQAAPARAQQAAPARTQQTAPARAQQTAPARAQQAAPARAQQAAPARAQQAAPARAQQAAPARAQQAAPAHAQPNAEQVDLPDVKRARPNTRRPASTVTMEWLRGYEEREAARHEARETQRNNQFEARNNILTRLLDIMEKK